MLDAILRFKPHDFLVAGNGFLRCTPFQQSVSEVLMRGREFRFERDGVPEVCYRVVNSALAMQDVAPADLCSCVFRFERDRALVTRNCLVELAALG